MSYDQIKFLSQSRPLEPAIPEVTPLGSILETNSEPYRARFQRLIHHYLIHRDPTLGESLIIPPPESTSHEEQAESYKFISGLIRLYGALAMRALPPDFTNKIYNHYLVTRRTPGIPATTREASADWFHVDGFDKTRSPNADETIVVVTPNTTACGHQVTSQQAGIGTLCAVLLQYENLWDTDAIIRVQHALQRRTTLETPELRRDSWTVRNIKKQFIKDDRNRIHREVVQKARTRGFVRAIDLHPGDLYISDDARLAHGRSTTAQGTALFID